MIDDDDKSEGSQRTTPYGMPERSGGETEITFPTPYLSPLAERYQILGELGRGGMGIVYKARDQETDEIVALKVLRPEIASRPDLIERFKAELRLARKITHKNVCRTHELLRFGGTVVITMEYVEGESLRGFLERFGTVPLRRGLEWVKQICLALSEAHAQDVVHRDLKPENILITVEGTAKVMDFGIARSVGTAPTSTGGSETGTLIGTPAYMSPEQAAGIASDHRSDIYAVGLVMYEMFTGRRAFHAETAAALLVKQIQDAPISPRELEPTLSVNIHRAIVRCLEKDPRRRFQSVSELVAALAAMPVSETPSVLTARPPEQISVPVSLSSWGKADHVLLALALIGTVGFFTLQEGTFPARALRLKTDRGVAIRAAKDFAATLDAPHAAVKMTGISIDSETWNQLMSKEGRDRTYAQLPRLKPIEWLVNFGSEDHDWTASVWISATDETPQLTTFRRNPATLRPEPEPTATADDLRAQARMIMQTVFRLEPEEGRVVGEQQARQEPYWAYELQVEESENKAPVTYGVALVSGEPSAVYRYVRVRDIQDRGDKLLPSIPRYWPLTSNVVMISVLLTLVVLGRRQFLVWFKPIIVASAIFGAAYAYWSLPTELTDASQTFSVLLYTFSYGGLLGFVVIGGTTTLAIRVYPESLEGLSALKLLRLSSKPLGLVLLRGTLFGLFFLGVFNLLVEIGIRTQSFWTDPGLAAHAITRSYPAMQGLANAIVQAVQLVLVGVLLPVVTTRRVLRRGPLSTSLITGLWMALLFVGVRIWMQPWPGTLVMLFIAGFVLAMAIQRFELLTVGVGVFTYCFWLINYPAYVMLQEIQPSSFYPIFLVWASLPVLGAVAYWWSNIRRGFEKFAEGI